MIELDQGSSSTTLRLKQTGVPPEHVVGLDAEWHRYYFDRMKAVFGWGIPSEHSR